MYDLPKDQIQKAVDKYYDTIYKQNYELKALWTQEMMGDTDSIREKMTLFWHSHFTTKFSIDEAIPAQLMYRQIDFFRKNHQGNLRKLIEYICTDAAMLIFLSGKESNKSSPNENFSRELLELYTTGIGHYTEDDVKEGARVFTGWSVNFFNAKVTDQKMLEPFFIAGIHDTGAKKYLGKTIPATTDNTQKGVLENEIKKLVDIILTEKSVQVSRYLSQKLYKFFVYSNEKAADESVINNMASTLVKSNWEVRPVLELLFNSAHFYDEKLKGVQIKTPAETIAGITKHFDIKPDWKDWVMKTMGMELLNPPNVAGWPGYRKWTDSRTYPFAIQQMGYFIWNQTDEYMLSWIKQFDNFDDSKLLTEKLTSFFLAKSVDANQIEKYQKIMLAGAPDYEWPEVLSKKETAGYRIKTVLIALTKSPSFHLN